MNTTILTSLSVTELKELLKEAVREVFGTGVLNGIKESLSELLDIKQAADFLRLKVTTLYEKTSKRVIPHIKKGGKLYFDRTQLEEWLKAGEIKTHEHLETEADTYLYSKKLTNNK